MKRYYIKTLNRDRIEYFDILGENDEGYRIRLTKIKDGDEKTLEDSMSRTLFDVCLKTGYIYELEELASSVA
ncbi:hypothetical protein LQZ21_14160 [Treponema sp. TIM-1]|uniref:hypothetical protein n=1 Tax=Treponema sp. TIM-1 TaxID=2898417 RepID=UPI00398087AC